MQLPAGRVVIELAPGFAPNHVANIKALAQGGFWDGTSIYRSQDNFVVQFGDADADDPAKARHFPANAKDKLPAEFTRDSTGVAFDRLPDVDGWAPQVGFARRFPGRARSSLGKDMDDALLRHRRRRPQQRAGQQHRRRALRRHRPGPARWTATSPSSGAW